MTTQFGLEPRFLHLDFSYELFCLGSSTDDLYSFFYTFHTFLGVHGRIILKGIFRNGDRGMDWIDLAQNRDRWSAVVNAVMEL